METVVAWQTGPSQSMRLPPWYPNQVWLSFSGPEHFTAKIQAQLPNGEYADLHVDGTPVSIDSDNGPRHVLVTPGLTIRMDVLNLTGGEPITMGAEL